MVVDRLSQEATDGRWSWCHAGCCCPGEVKGIEVMALREASDVSRP